MHVLVRWTHVLSSRSQLIDKESLGIEKMVKRVRSFARRLLERQIESHESDNQQSTSGPSSNERKNIVENFSTIISHSFLMLDEAEMCRAWKERLNDVDRKASRICVFHKRAHFSLRYAIEEITFVSFVSWRTFSTQFPVNSLIIIRRWIKRRESWGMLACFMEISEMKNVFDRITNQSTSFDGFECYECDERMGLMMSI